MNRLTEDEDFILKNLTLLPAETYTLVILFEIFQFPDKHYFKRLLDSLSQKGWLFSDKNTYRLNTVVQKLVLHKNQEQLWPMAQYLVQNIAQNLEVNQEQDAISNKFKWLPFGERLLSIFSAFHSNNDYSNLQSNQANVLRYLVGTSNLLKAKELLTKSLTFTNSYFGKSSIDSSRNQSDLALVLLNLGGEENLREAVKLLRETIKTANRLREHSAIALYESYTKSILLCRICQIRETG